MGDQEAISAKVEHARQVEKVLHWLGWLVVAVGAAGMAVYTVFWAAGDLSAEQGVSLVLGTMLATVLSGATAYGAGVNIGLGAERLHLAARAPGAGLLPQGHPASDRMAGGSAE
jgi:predicted anti-sigma-YlaC factor YlaD